jgi:hypothetical protein
MLEHDLERGEIGHQLAQRALDEHRLAVEDIDMAVGHFAMDQQRHADLLHALQHRIDRGTLVTPWADPVVAWAG